MNPAFVMPTLRKVLIQILTELEFSGIGRNKEQSARLLGHLVANSPKLVKPYQGSILKVREAIVGRLSFVRGGALVEVWHETSFMGGLRWSGVEVTLWSEVVRGEVTLWSEVVRGGGDLMV